MGNPSSLHGLGTTATRLLEASRRQIAELLGVDSQEIFFTSGGTEGDNWILKFLFESVLMVITSLFLM
ncbi:Cysteine desulfurase IscS [Lactococcus lactis]|nr:Cysteine desulfurase IscS [Lactococcus lactis]